MQSINQPHRAKKQRKYDRVKTLVAEDHSPHDPQMAGSDTPDTSCLTAVTDRERWDCHDESAARYDTVPVRCEKIGESWPQLACEGCIEMRHVHRKASPRDFVLPKKCHAA